MKTIETITWNPGTPSHERPVLCATDDGMRILSFDRLDGYWNDANYERVYCEVYGWCEPKGPKARKAARPVEVVDNFELLIVA